MSLRQSQEQKSTTELLRQAARDASASVDVANDTSRQLATQGEQMDRIDRDLDTIEYELKVSDRIVKGMSSWGGMIASWFTSAPKKPKDTHRQIGDHPPREESRTQQSAQTRPQVVDRRQQADRRQEVDRKRHDDDDDDLLDALAGNLAVLKTQAHLHREVIDEHNKKLDALSTKNDHVMSHMQRTDRNIRKML